MKEGLSWPPRHGRGSGRQRAGWKADQTQNPPERQPSGQCGSPHFRGLRMRSRNSQAMPLLPMEEGTMLSIPHFPSAAESFQNDI